MSDKNRIYIFDTTLRDGEQSPGVSLNVEEKIEIAQQLARLGVDIIEAGFPIDKANIELGYAFMSGDKDGMSGDVENAGALGQGEDWEKVFILTGNDHGMDGTLGGGDGAGNILSVGSDMNNAGMNLMYLGGNYQVNDSLSLGGLFAYATADDAPTSYKDDYGMEMDLHLSVKFLGNLEYKAVAGYLMAGDFWKKGTTTKVDDVIALYHEIVLSF